MDTGVLAGFPVLDVEIELLDGGFHAVDSSAVALKSQRKAHSVSLCLKLVLNFLSLSCT